MFKETPHSLSSNRIDAHQHFWRYDPRVHKFIGQNMPVLKRDYLPEHAHKELTQADIGGCVAVQAPQTLEETRFLLELSDAHEFIRAVVGWVDLRASDLDDVLAHFVAHPKLRGIRHIIDEEPDEFFESTAFKKGVARLAHYQLSYDMLVCQRQWSLAHKFMASLPDVQFVLDHVGKPDLKNPNVAEFLQALRPIAELPHVVCKLSGLVTQGDWGSWTPFDLRPFIEGAVELFGIKRLLFGSDWPVCLLSASYAEVCGVVDDYFAAFSESERALLWGENAIRAYRMESAAR